MELNVYGLKCDNPVCDYQDNSIKLEQYEDYINYPCPKCSAPLLTQADYDTTMVIIQAEKSAEELGLSDNNLNHGEKFKLRVELDGSGVPKFDMKQVE
ncbi:hypothetical protein FJQ98_11990 [Lysinibacillus agricola]|uniref:Uncharacterized protein n=1 Tax=Lysinibacillus agricola TaxID=2590012 RepID=A0ABX7AXE4_9BACI|nr:MULTISPECIES: hypothetical protein [Lysinibacillus]KOS60574.1 hypothetical protein AN161_22505 [Lysinibacillus sp. FJAT-14222]QQP14655.1 hypothetical protein FJQ98_11990 [Lysinibacillus agricola]